MYGDGSAGALTVSADGYLFSDYAANGNTQFTSITVNSGKALLVPGGTILRATGDVTINGQVVALVQNLGGTLMTADGTLSTFATAGYRPPGLGIAVTPAGLGELGSSTAERIGGRGGLGVGDAALTLSYNLLRGGGGGAPGAVGILESGQFGAGAVMIIAAGTITVNGSIDASSDSLGGINGGGGGGGGVVVLASKTAISNQGVIEAKGGQGNKGASQGASGGGGGGGLIMLAAPSVTAGTLQVNGGEGGDSRGAGVITASPRLGGGGGGGSVGSGGSGANAKTDGSCSQGGSGDPGKAIVMQVDPTSLL